MSRRPTIKDVAKRAGVSFKTVSRVINDEAGVSKQVQLRVRRAVAELGYVVNYSARSLAQGSSRTIGVLLQNITDAHSYHLLYQVGVVSQRLRTDVIILNRPTAWDEISLSNFIGHGIVGALLFIAPGSIEPFGPIAKSLGIPTAVVETLFTTEDGKTLETPFPCISSDHRRGAHDAVNYLYQLGHRRIAHLSGPVGNQSRLRLLGYKDGLAQRGLAFRAEYVANSDWTWESGYAMVDGVMALPEPPTALFCGNDSIAIGAMRRLRERGVDVPRAVSVIGFDDIPDAAHSVPALTTIHQQAYEMIHKAMSMLMQAVDGEDLSPDNYVLSTRIIERESCAPVRAGALVG